MHVEYFEGWSPTGTFVVPVRSIKVMLLQDSSTSRSISFDTQFTVLTGCNVGTLSPLLQPRVRCEDYERLI